MNVNADVCPVGTLPVLLIIADVPDDGVRLHPVPAATRLMAGVPINATDDTAPGRFLLSTSKLNRQKGCPCVEGAKGTALADKESQSTNIGGQFNTSESLHGGFVPHWK